MSNHAKQLLQEYLQQQASHGVSHVWLNKEARTSLRPPGRADALPQAPEARAPAPERTFAAPKSSPATVAPVTRPYTPESPLPAASPGSRLIESTDEKKVELDRLALQADNSERVRALGTLRDVMVFATGSPDADVMFIGEAPGAEEEKQREPFVGPAGQTLTKIIQAMGLRRSEVYITNICKYRPIVDDGRPQNNRNRAPSVGEMQACLPYVTAEINIIQPKVIVALGSTAATGLGIEGTVGKLRGRFTEFRSVPVMVTYHPSYLLRREQEDGGGVAEKRLVWEDMLMVMERIGLPISEKQRGYFSKAR